MNRGKRIHAALAAVAVAATLAACGAASPPESTEPPAAASISGLETPVPVEAAPSDSEDETAPETPAPPEAGSTDAEQETRQQTETPAGGTVDVAAPETTDITLSFGDAVITATLDHSETSSAFMSRLPVTLTMSRYADREYYAAIETLPENGNAIADFENGDVTYYTTGKSLAIFFGNADSSSQDGLIRMGKITSDLSLFDRIGDRVEVTISLLESEASMADYDFSAFTNVEITGLDLSTLNEEELSVLYQQARYCQAMTDADTETMSEIVPADRLFTHMSGRQQTREEYFADVQNGSLRYFTIGIENPMVEVDGNHASVTFTSVLNANAYGARGTYRIEGTHWYEKRDGVWILSGAPEK